MRTQEDSAAIKVAIREARKTLKVLEWNFPNEADEVTEEDERGWS
jgi:flavin-binding protein dodecin